MTKFRKKPVVIDAIQFVGGIHSVNEIQNWAFESGVKIIWHFNHNRLSIPTLEGIMSASAGDWIIRGIRGEYYPCKPDIFEETYEMVDET